MIRPSCFTAITQLGPFDAAVKAFAGDQGVLRAVLAILAFSWFGLFVFFGGWLSVLLLQGLAGSEAFERPSGTLYWLLHILLWFLVAFALSGRATGSRYVQAVVGVLVVLSIPGAAMVASLLGSPRSHPGNDRCIAMDAVHEFRRGSAASDCLGIALVGHACQATDPRAVSSRRATHHTTGSGWCRHCRGPHNGHRHSRWS